MIWEKLELKNYCKKLKSVKNKSVPCSISGGAILYKLEVANNEYNKVASMQHFEEVFRQEKSHVEILNLCRDLVKSVANKAYDMSNGIIEE